MNSSRFWKYFWYNREDPHVFCCHHWTSSMMFFSNILLITQRRVIEGHMKTHALLSQSLDIWVHPFRASESTLLMHSTDSSRILLNIMRCMEWTNLSVKCITVCVPFLWRSDESHPESRLSTKTREDVVHPSFFPDASTSSSYCMDEVSINLIRFTLSSKRDFTDSALVFLLQDEESEKETLGKWRHDNLEVGNKQRISRGNCVL